MFYSVSVNNKTYSTNIKQKKQAIKIAETQAKTGNKVVVFRRYPETDKQPGHTEMIWYYIFGKEVTTR